VRVVEYDPSRREALADLMQRVWETRPDEQELAWFYEQNPVRPASVLLAEVDGRTVATAAIAFTRMSLAGETLEVGMPLRVATDPAYRGQGIFARLEAENEERVRGLGIRLLLTVPNAASAPVFLGRLGWRSLPSLRVWVRLRLRRGHSGGARRVERFEAPPQSGGEGDRVLRDDAWLNWRFADAPAPYRLLEGQGYAVTGRRGRFGVVACVEGDLLGQAALVAEGGSLLLAAPPPWRRRAYALAGYLPSRRSFTVLGKALDPAQAVPAHPHFELGDLDFL
jgi:GNAT superfamily N-acetyltransferase